MLLEDPPDLLARELHTVGKSPICLVAADSLEFGQLKKDLTEGKAAYSMRLLNIASGSSGNATYIGTDSTHIL